LGLLSVLRKKKEVFVTRNFFIPLEEKMRSHFQKSAHIREVLLKDTYYVSELLEG
jgi:hypothetical protein